MESQNFLFLSENYENNKAKTEMVLSPILVFPIVLNNNTCEEFGYMYY